MPATREQLINEIKRVQQKVLLAGRRPYGDQRDTLLTSYNAQLQKHNKRLREMGSITRELSLRK